MCCLGKFIPGATRVATVLLSQCLATRTYFCASLQSCTRTARVPRYDMKYDSRFTAFKLAEGLAVRLGLAPDPEGA